MGRKDRKLVRLSRITNRLSDKQKNKNQEVKRESALEIIKLIEAVCIGLAAIGGGVAIIVKCVNSINEQHDRREKYDAYDERINNLSIKQTELEKKFDNQFEKYQEKMQTDIDAKFQQISSELCMLSYCVGATLDGLKQLNCNGKVSEAKEKMDKHLNQQAHGEI